MLPPLNYNNKPKNWLDNTTITNAIGYVAAYADATSSVFVTPISVPSAGVLVIPPHIEPSVLNILSFNTFAAKKYPLFCLYKYVVPINPLTAPHQIQHRHSTILPLPVQ